MTIFKEILKASSNKQASIFAFTFKFKTTVYIRLTTFQVDKIKASWPKIDFCLYKDFAKQGVALELW